jgi:hypothetical protein
MKIEIAESDISTFWEMLERAVEDLGSAIDGNTCRLGTIGASDTEDTILEYARFLMFYRKLRKQQPNPSARRGDSPKGP